jgi:hypothetical protein
MTVRDFAILAGKTLTKASAAVPDAEEEVPKWQYQREKYPKQDVIRDVQLFGSLMHLRFASALTAVSLLHHTEFARIADITRV